MKEWQGKIARMKTSRALKESERSLLLFAWRKRVQKSESKIMKY